MKQSSADASKQSELANARIRTRKKGRHVRDVLQVHSLFDRQQSWRMSPGGIAHPTRSLMNDQPVLCSNHDPLTHV